MPEAVSLQFSFIHFGKQKLQAKHKSIHVRYTLVQPKEMRNLEETVCLQVIGGFKDFLLDN